MGRRYLREKLKNNLYRIWNQALAFIIRIMFSDHLLLLQIIQGLQLRPILVLRLCLKRPPPAPQFAIRIVVRIRELISIT